MKNYRIYILVIIHIVAFIIYPPLIIGCLFYNILGMFTDWLYKDYKQEEVKDEGC